MIMMKKIVLICTLFLILVSGYIYYQLQFAQEMQSSNDEHSFYRAQNSALSDLNMKRFSEMENYPENLMLSGANLHLMSSYIDLNEYSLDEKIGQLIFTGIEGTTLSSSTEERLRRYPFGGVILFKNNILNVEQTNEFISQISLLNEMHPFPLFFGIDEEGGRVSRVPNEMKILPKNRSIGSARDATLSYQVGEILGKQLSHIGFNLNFSPVLDVDSNPRNPVIGDRSFSSDPQIVAKLGVATLKGMQDKRVIPVVKHFPGHGDTEVDSHIDLPKIDKGLEELAQMELIPFESAIKEGADIIMTGHILLPQLDATLPASISPAIITTLLREKMGFSGVVITDDFAMGAIQKNFQLGDAAVASILAGGDIVLIAGEPDKAPVAFEAIKEAVEKRVITEERLDESVRRILLLKEKYKIKNEREITELEVINNLVEKIEAEVY